MTKLQMIFKKGKPIHVNKLRNTEFSILFYSILVNSLLIHQKIIFFHTKNEDKNQKN